MAGTTTTYAAAARTAVVLLLSLGTSVIEGQSRSNGEIRCCQLSVLCCSRRPNDRLKVSVSTTNEPLAWSIFCRSAARRTEGREEGREMRCVQNGRLERKERERSTHNNGIEREERERVYIAALACLPKRRRRAMLMKQRQVALFM